MGKNKTTLLQELASVYELLGMPFEQADHADRTNSEIEEELEKFQPAVDRLLEQQVKLKELEAAQASAEVPGEIGTLIILRNRKSSHAEMVYRQTKSVVNGEVLTKPSIKIEFNEVAAKSETFCWNSDTMYRIAPHIEEKHGGRQGVLRLIKNWADTMALRNPGLYEVIDSERYELLMKHPYLKEQAEAVINMAMKNARSPQYKALIEQIEQLSAAAGKPLVTSHVVPGPVSVG